MATSRVALHLAAEYKYSVSPLALPDLRSVSGPARLAHIESVSLFVQRAQAVRPDFELTQNNSHAVAELCVRLDGLPLAIELAAARTRLLPPEAMLPRLERSLALLTRGACDLPERQRTLRRTIEWSYELLGTVERHMLARLAVFAGGCSLEAVEAVCAGEGEDETEILESLDVLVDNSLLRQEKGFDGQPRFHMLETVREYALKRLEEHGKATTFFSRHTEYYVQLCERAEPEMDGPRQCEWFERLDMERDNVRAAIAWSQANDIGKAVRLCSALWLWWYTHGYMREGQRWMEAALEARCSLPDPLQLKLLNSAGDLAWSLGNYERATRLLEEALSLARLSGDRRGITLSLNHLANVALYQGNYESATQLLEESLKLERADGDRRGIGASLTILGSVALQQGEPCPGDSALRGEPWSGAGGRQPARYSCRLARPRQCGDL